jgi:hypothetical protein
MPVIKRRRKVETAASYKQREKMNLISLTDTIQDVSCVEVYCMYLGRSAMYVVGTFCTSNMY